MCVCEGDRNSARARVRQSIQTETEGKEREERRDCEMNADCWPPKSGAITVTVRAGRHDSSTIHAGGCVC